MNKDDLIKKWLDHNLNPDELKAFEALEDYNDLMHMSKSLKGFKAPHYNTDSEYNSIKTQLKYQKKNTARLKPLLKIAAVLLIGLSVYYYSSNLDTEVQTLIAQQTTIILPDASTVDLNAQSTLSYNKNKWNQKREISLNGEAFFKVAKGSKFDVKTKTGVITVLGTQFNVKQRNNYFEVTCFEGLVAVTHNGSTIKLKPGNKYVYYDGKTIKNEKESNAKPSWTTNESSFTSRPLKFVINEFERQYNIKIIADAVPTNQLFSGSFTHQDMGLALRSITSPLSLTYTNTNNTIILKSE